MNSQNRYESCNTNWKICQNRVAITASAAIAAVAAAIAAVAAAE